MVNHLCFSKTLTLTSIPDDLIFDNILPRLPVISLIRFKSVSKSWYSVICTPHFTNSHLQFSSSLSPPHFLLQSQNDIYTLAYNNNRHDNLKELVKLEQPWNYKLEVVGCCNGLICFSLIEDGDVNTCKNMFIVWNPATRQHRTIISNSIPPCHYPSEMKSLGFGYCGSTHDFKIVAGLQDDNCLWVFSLRVGHWKSVDFPSDHLFLGVLHNLTAIHIDGTLYWSAWVKDSTCLYSFCLIDEQFNHEVVLSKKENLISMTDTPKLVVFKGCLSIIFDFPSRQLVFVMKRQGDSTLKKALFYVPIARISKVMSYCLGFSTTGKVLIIESHFDQNPKLCRSELKLVDSTSGNLEHSQGIGFQHPNVDSVHQYIESLVSPFTLM